MLWHLPSPQQAAQPGLGCPPLACSGWGQRLQGCKHPQPVYNPSMQFLAVTVILLVAQEGAPDFKLKLDIGRRGVPVVKGAGGKLPC